VVECLLITQGFGSISNTTTKKEKALSYHPKLLGG
jgi:hypothetical protein